MSGQDDNWMLWNAPPMKLAQRDKRREWLYALRREDHALECELLFHGEYGVEARWLRDGELFYSRVFITKALALAWAEEELADARAEGWHDVKLSR